MKDAFKYATNQALGMQFEVFTYSIPGVRYVWEVHPVITWVMSALLLVSEPVTQWLFNRLLKVEF